MATNRRSAGSQQHEQHICGFNCSRHQHHGAVTTVRGRRPWCHFLAPKARHGHRPRTVLGARQTTSNKWLVKLLRFLGLGTGWFVSYLVSLNLKA